MTTTLRSDVTGYGALQVGGADVLRFGNDSSGQLAGFRNKIINGDFRIWQRGTSLSPQLQAVTYTADRWIAYIAGAQVTIRQGNGDGTFKSCLAIDGASGNTIVNIVQRFESKSVYGANGRTLTVRCKLYSTVAGVNVGWNITSANSEDDFNSTTVVTSGVFPVLSAGWNDVKISFTTNAACNNGFQLEFNMGATGAGVTKGIGQVQLEEGSIATPFEHRPIGLELQLCKYYFRRIGKTGGASFAVGMCVSSTAVEAVISFPRMRATPTASASAPSTFRIRYSGGAISVSSMTFDSGQDSVIVYPVVSSGLTAGQAVTFQRTDGQDPYIDLSAEL